MPLRGRELIPLQEYYAEVSASSVEAFCARHPCPFLVDLGSPYRCVDDDLPAGMTLDRMVLDPPRAPTNAFFAAEIAATRLGDAIVTVGTAESCDVIVHAPSISNQHAWFTFAKGEWMLWDNESSFGTFVNDRPLSRNRPHVLASADRITLGTVDLQFVGPEAFFAMVSALLP